MNKVPVFCKVDTEKRKKFKYIIHYKLNSKIFDVLEIMINEFLEKWKTAEGKKELYLKYFNKPK